MKVKYNLYFGLALAILALGACQGPQGPGGPTYAEIGAQIPPLAPDHARIFFYREYEPYEGLSRPYIRLNNNPVTISEPGGVSYRDVAPGTYFVSVDTAGLYPDQFKTLAFAAGQTYYIQIQSYFHYNTGDVTIVRDTLVVAPMDAERGKREIQDKHVVTGT